MNFSKFILLSGLLGMRAVQGSFGEILSQSCCREQRGVTVGFGREQGYRMKDQSQPIFW